MRKIIGQKIYDTDKAKIIAEWPYKVYSVKYKDIKLWERIKICLGSKPCEETFSLYKSTKGNYFLLITIVSNTIFHQSIRSQYIEPIDDLEAEKWVADRFTIEEYEKIFGKVEEA